MKSNNIRNISIEFVKRVYVQCTKSGFYFPVISFAMLVPLLLGYYNLELHIDHIIPHIFLRNFTQILQEILPSTTLIAPSFEQFRKYREIWAKYMDIVLNAVQLPSNPSFDIKPDWELDAGYVVTDFLIGNSNSWELERILRLGVIKDYTVYLLTQIANVKNSSVCGNCRRVWIYCHPPVSSMKGYYDERISHNICPRCGHELLNNDDLEVFELRTQTGPMMVMLKKYIFEHRFGDFDTLHAYIEERLVDFKSQN